MDSRITGKKAKKNPEQGKFAAALEAVTTEVKELKEMVPNQTSQSSSRNPVTAPRYPSSRPEINAGQITEETYVNIVLNVAPKVTLPVVVDRPSRETRDSYCQGTGSS